MNVILIASTFLYFLFKSIMNGREPSISITEKRMSVTEKNSLKFILSITDTSSFPVKNTATEIGV